MTEGVATLRSERRVAASIVTLLAGLALAYIAMRAFDASWASARALLASRGTGWVALAALLSSSIASSVGQLAARLRIGWLTKARVSTARRALGLAALSLALAHALVGYGTTLGGHADALWTWPHLRAGLVALVVLVLLGLTSFDRVVRALRMHTWKELHRLSYVAVLLVLQHVVLAPFAPLRMVLIVFGVTLGLWLLRALWR